MTDPAEQTLLRRSKTYKHFMEGHERFFVVEGGLSANDNQSDKVLIIKDEVIIRQNDQSREWGDIVGKKFCDICTTTTCSADTCAILASRMADKSAEIFRFVRGVFCRVTATPARVGKSIYYIVAARKASTPFISKRLMGVGGGDFGTSAKNR